MEHSCTYTTTTPLLISTHGNTGRNTFDNDTNDTVTGQQTAATNTGRKKPGRKRNPLSQVLRKAQNRVAQKAFRERKQKHIRKLEETTAALKEEYDLLLKKNKELLKKKSKLGQEGWNLRGIILSLQLVCLMSGTNIATHLPHLEKKYLLNAALDGSTQSEIISTYEATKNKLEQQLLNTTTSSTKGMVINEENEQEPLQPEKPQEEHDEDEENDVIRISAGTILVDSTSVRNVIGNKLSIPRQPIPPHRFQKKRNPASPSQSSVSSRHRNNPAFFTYASSSIKNNVAKNNTTPNKGSNEDNTTDLSTNDNAVQQPIQLTRQALPTFDLVKFQIVRLQLKLQDVSEKLFNVTIKLEPTSLQTSIPHDLRIDLIPIAAIRDRMILFRHLYYADECFQYLTDGMEYQGGDPLKASSWKFPTIFYEKFWFLTHNYDIKKIKKQWPELEKRKDKVDILLEDTMLTAGEPLPQAVFSGGIEALSPCSPAFFVDQRQRLPTSVLSQYSSTADSVFLTAPFDIFSHPKEERNNDSYDINITSNNDGSIIIPAEIEDMDG